jgi:hypothetical protein
MKSLAPIKILDPAEEARIKAEADKAAQKIKDIESKLEAEKAQAQKAQADFAASFATQSEKAKQEFAVKQAALEEQQKALEAQLQQQKEANMKLMKRKELQNREQLFFFFVILFVTFVSNFHLWISRKMSVSACNHKMCTMVGQTRPRHEFFCSHNPVVLLPLLMRCPLDAITNAFVLIVHENTHPPTKPPTRYWEKKKSVPCQRFKMRNFSV